MTRSGMQVYYLKVLYILRIIVDLQEQNFDILTGYDNEPIIAFHLSNAICEYGDGSVSQNFDIKTDGRGIEVLNGLCHQVRDFRMILYSSGLNMRRLPVIFGS